MCVIGKSNIVCYWVCQIVRVLLPSCLTPPMKGGSVVPKWKQAKAKPTLPLPLWSCITFAKYCATAKEKPSSEHESCLEKHYVATFPNFFSQYLWVLAHGLYWHSLILPLLPVYFPKIIKFYESWF